MTATRLYFRPDSCRYCQRYGKACGRPHAPATTTAAQLDPTDTARRIMAEVLGMLADGHRSAEGRTMLLEDIVHGGYPELQNFTDANMLGGMCDDGFPEQFATTEDWVDHCDQAQDIVDVWLRAGAPDPADRPVAWHATCGQCGEVFNPADPADLVHLEREDGQPCGGLARNLDSYR
jgi:hypothetical protein